ncbi:MAG: PKD domain-containing protein [Bacteroidaceae bacterium]
MRKSLFIIAFVALFLSVVSCEKEEFARPATYGKIYCSPSNPKVGDTVTLIVEVPDAGNRIYHADYTWKCKDQFSQTVRVTAPDNSKTITEAPSFKWVFKKSGSYSVTMSAKFKFSMADENGSMIGVGGASGTIKIGN